MDFGRLLGPIWELKWHPKIDEILDAFLEAKKEFRRFFGVGPAECAGSLGRIMEGYKNQICQKIEGKGSRARGKELWHWI